MSKKKVGRELITDIIKRVVANRDDIQSDELFIRTWDKRRWVLPLSYFIENPIQNWTRKETDIKSMAVGVIIDPHQAEEILQSGGADLVALGRELMHDPFWPLHAAEALGADPDFKMWPEQYAWAVDRRSQIARLNLK